MTRLQFDLALGEFEMACQKIGEAEGIAPVLARG